MAHAPRPRTAHWWPTLGIMLGGLAVAMSQGSLNVAIPSMMSSLGTDLDRIQWVQTGYGIAQAVLIPASAGSRHGWAPNACSCSPPACFFSARSSAVWPGTPTR